VYNIAIPDLTREEVIERVRLSLSLRSTKLKEVNLNETDLYGANYEIPTRE